jgi:hypothetical protein
MSLLSGLFGNASEISANDVAKQLAPLLIEGEQVVKAYKLIRDQLIFTNCRVIYIDKQGLTGNKQEITSIPYRSIDRFSMENAGFMDMDSEIKVWLKGQPHPAAWKFTKGSNIVEAHQVLAAYVLR